MIELILEYIYLISLLIIIYNLVKYYNKVIKEDLCKF